MNPSLQSAVSVNVLDAYREGEVTSAHRSATFDVSFMFLFFHKFIMRDRAGVSCATLACTSDFDSYLLIMTQI